MYSKTAYDHFTNPRNAYKMKGFSGMSQVGDPGCGDKLDFYIRVEGNIIKEVSYLVFGCPAAIATSSMTSVLAKGKSLEEALALKESDVIDSLEGLPEGKDHCSNLGIGALKRAIEDYNKRKKD